MFLTLFLTRLWDNMIGMKIKNSKQLLDIFVNDISNFNSIIWLYLIHHI